jgi:hypothetical protein
MSTREDAIDRLMESVIVDAYGDDEQLEAFVVALEDHLPFLKGGLVSGSPAALLGVEADGWPRHPLVTYRRGGQTGRASLLDITAPVDSEVAELLVAYRRWAGLPGVPQNRPAGASPVNWAYALSTKPEGKRAAVLVDRLRGRPLRLQFLGMWKPEDDYWGEPEDEIDPIFTDVIVAGERPECEMEQVLPGADLEDLDDPITWSVDLKNAGHVSEARAVLRDLLAQDARCIDAHVHIGNLMFDRDPSPALVHYQTAVAIGEAALPPGYTGLLPWGFIDNRPFLRGLHGMGLSLWRLGREPEAVKVFETMLWLSPSDQQGVRFSFAAVQDGVPWKELSE